MRTSQPDGHLIAASDVVIRPRRVLGATLSITAALFVLHIPHVVLASSDAPVTKLTNRFDLGSDAAFPTWFAAAFLALAAAGLAWIAVLSQSTDRANTRHWSVLAVIFLVLSIDEVATFHEAFGRFDVFSGYSGLFYYGWVFGGIAVVVVVGAAYIPFLVRLDRRTRSLFVLSGAIYVSGALGIEMLNASLASEQGEQNWRYALQTGIEEVAEFAGTSLFLYAVADNLMRRSAGVTVAFGSSTHEDRDAGRVGEASGPATHGAVEPSDRHPL